MGTALKPRVPEHARQTVAPQLDEILDFCGREPVERVFLEDVARRGLGRFAALRRDGQLSALCHVGANVVPSGNGCEAFAAVVARGRPRMVIGEEKAVGELWNEAEDAMPEPREDRPGQPVYVLERAPAPGETGCARPASKTSTCYCRRAGRLITKRSGSTRSPAIPRAFAGAPRLRSARVVRGSGLRTARSSSRLRRQRGRLLPSCSSRCGLIRRCGIRGTRSGG